MVEKVLDGGMHYRFPFVIRPHAHFRLAFGFKQTELIFRQLKRELKADPLKSDGMVQFVSLL